MLWSCVLLLSFVASVLFVWDALQEYSTSPTRIGINSTNTPISFKDFPVLTLCNANKVSRNLVTAKGASIDNITTETKAKRVG